MKKLTGIFFAVLAMMSCGSDDGYEPSAQLTVLRSECVFSAAAAEGLIEIAPAAGLQAQSDADWCTVSVSDNATVQVRVERNTSLDGRSAVVLLTAKQGTARVSVTQQGAIWNVKGSDSYTVGDGASQLLIPVRSDYEYTVDQPDWVTGQQTGSGYEVTLQPNRTGQVRLSQLTLRSEKGERTIKIYQMGPDDLAGTYQVDYTTPVSGSTEQEEHSATVTLVQSDTDPLLFYVEGLSVIPGVRLPMTYDEADFTLTVTAGQSLGQVGTQQRYVFTALGSAYGAHVSTSVKYVAPSVIDAATVQPVFTFEDKEGIIYYDSNGDAQHTTIDAILTIGTVTDRASLDANNFLGYADRIYHPIFRKLP